MLAFIATERAIAGLKIALSAAFPAIKPTHRLEAFAFAAGFNTHAALTSQIKNATAAPPVFPVSLDRFALRLVELQYPPTEFDPGKLRAPSFAKDVNSNTEQLAPDMDSLRATLKEDQALFETCKDFLTFNGALPAYLSREVLASDRSPPKRLLANHTVQELVNDPVRQSATASFRIGSKQDLKSLVSRIDARWNKLLPFRAGEYTYFNRWYREVQGTSNEGIVEVEIALLVPMTFDMFKDLVTNLQIDPMVLDTLMPVTSKNNRLSQDQD